MLFVASCGGDDYDDTALRNELTDLANRVAKLEQLCQQMNTNISSLQTIVNALQQNDFITAVVPVTQGGKVIGYTITFSRSGAITIYHGNDGADGKDGSTPQISVKQDSDGIYYWTLNGEWLLDANGNKIQAEGKDGADGSNGTNGTDGITPQLKIEEGYWYISYDNGSSWTQLGKAVGEDGADGSDGIDGSDGQDGDSIFSKVTQDDEFVYFYLSDGTMITLPKHDKENIQFEDLKVKAICCKDWDTNNDGELSYAEAAAVTDIGTTFKGNTNIITFNELKYFTGLTVIADNAFEGCTNLWKVQLPNTVEMIGDSAFENCSNLTNMNLPQCVKSLGNWAFYGCRSLNSLELPKSLTSIGQEALSGFRGKMTICCNVPDGTYSVYPFEGASFSEVKIVEGVTSIGSYAFYYQMGIKSINLPETLTMIGSCAFDLCTSLTSIELPKNLNSIGSYAFTRCKSLTSIYCRAITPPKCSFDTFNDVTATIYVPKEALSAYQATQYWSDMNLVGYDFDE